MRFEAPPRAPSRGVAKRNPSADCEVGTYLGRHLKSERWAGVRGGAGGGSPKTWPESASQSAGSDPKRCHTRRSTWRSRSRAPVPGRARLRPAPELLSFEGDYRRMLPMNDRRTSCRRPSCVKAAADRREPRPRPPRTQPTLGSLGLAGADQAGMPKRSPWPRRGERATDSWRCAVHAEPDALASGASHGRAKRALASTPPQQVVLVARTCVQSRAVRGGVWQMFGRPFRLRAQFKSTNPPTLNQNTAKAGLPSIPKCDGRIARPKPSVLTSTRPLGLRHNANKSAAARCRTADRSIGAHAGGHQLPSVLRATLAPRREARSSQVMQGSAIEGVGADCVAVPSLQCINGGPVPIRRRLRFIVGLIFGHGLDCALSPAASNAPWHPRTTTAHMHRPPARCLGASAGAYDCHKCTCSRAPRERRPWRACTLPHGEAAASMGTALKQPRAYKIRTERNRWAGISGGVQRCQE